MEDKPGVDLYEISTKLKFFGCVVTGCDTANANDGHFASHFRRDHLQRMVRFLQ